MFTLNIFFQGKVIVDPDNQYNLQPEEVSRFLHDSGGTLINWFSELNFEEDPLDRIWDWYPFGIPNSDSKVKIINNKYIYPNDPVLSPLLNITTEVKGYKEEFLIYPYSLVAYLKEGELISHGRMD